MSSWEVATLAFGIICISLGMVFCFSGWIAVLELSQQKEILPSGRRTVNLRAMGDIPGLALYVGLVVSLIGSSWVLREVRREPEEYLERLKRIWHGSRLVRKLFNAGGWCLVCGGGLILWAVTC